MATRPHPTYPLTRRDDSVNAFHAIEIPEPYQWLNHFEDPEVMSWVAAQERSTDEWIGDAPRRATRLQLLAKLPESLVQHLPARAGGRRFDVASDPVSRCCLRIHDDNGAVHALNAADLDIACDSQISEEFLFPSPSGNYLAYGFCSAGSDWHCIGVLDVARHKSMGTPIACTANPVVSWSPDEAGFFYNATRAKLGLKSSPSVPDGVYYHLINGAASADHLVYDYDDGAGHAALPHVSADGRWLFIKEYDFVTNKAGLLFRRLGTNEGWQRLFSDLEASADLIGLHAHHLYLATDLHAVDGRIVRIDLNKAARADWQDVVPCSDQVLARSSHSVVSRTSALVGGELVVTMLHNGTHCIKAIDLQGGQIRTLALPFDGSVLAMQTARADSLRVGMTSYFQPFSVYSYAAGDSQLTPVHEVAPILDPSRYSIRRLDVKNPDGSDLPLTLIAPKNMGRAPRRTLLYGYGGAGYALTPELHPDALVWLAEGNLYAIAHVRGGGDRGRAWADAGRGNLKQTSFDDFCTAARFLISSGYTTASQLAIRGISYGGLLVTACYNQAPELFGAAIAEVPLVDALGFIHRPVGAALAADLGNPLVNLTDFLSLRAYSPLHNVGTASAPPLLLVAAARDERAPPGPIAQFLATVQSANPRNVALLRVLHGDGHAGWARTTLHALIAEEMDFLDVALPAAENG